MSPLERINVIRDLPLGRNQKLVLFLLSAYQGSKDWSFPSAQTLARNGGLGLTVVRVALRELRKARLIKVKQRGHRSAHYALTLPERAEAYQNLTRTRVRIRQHKKYTEGAHTPNSDKCWVCQKRLAAIHNQCEECIAARERRRIRKTLAVLPSL